MALFFALPLADPLNQRQNSNRSIISDLVWHSIVAERALVVCIFLGSSVRGVASLEKETEILLPNR